MSATDDFISHALLNVRNLTDMVRAPFTLRRGVAQRARARLKLLEVIVRRLVLLLALSLRLVPVRPRAPGPATPLPPAASPACWSACAKKGEPRPVCLPVAGAYRLRPELGMVASALPGLVNAGLESWNDTS